MSLILVVEKDAGFANRIASCLRGQGYSVDAVTDCQTGLQQAALRSPALVLVSGVLPGAADLLSRYSAERGGPGSVVLVPAQMADQMKAEPFGADHLLPNPVPEAELLSIARQRISSRLPEPPDPPLLPNVGAQLTSEEIFGDVLAEVEADANVRLTSPSGSPSHSPPPADPRGRAASLAPPRQGRPADSVKPAPVDDPLATGLMPALGAEETVKPSAPAKPPETAGSARRQADDDIDRKLEETLSGFFPDKLRKPSSKDTAKPKKAPAPSANEIEDLLDKTLSSLEIPSLAKKPRREAPPAPKAPAVAPPQAPAGLEAPGSPAPATSAPAASRPDPVEAPPQPSAPPVSSFSPPNFGAAAGSAAPAAAGAGSPAGATEGSFDPAGGERAFEFQSPAETVRLERTSIDSEVSPAPAASFADPPPPQAPSPSAIEAEVPNAGIPRDAAAPALPVPASEDSGTFNLPSMEPLEPLTPDSWAAVSEPSGAPAPQDSAQSFSSFATPALTAPDLEAPSLDIPVLDPPNLEPADPTATGGWSVSSFTEIDDPAPTLASLDSGGLEAGAKPESPGSQEIAPSEEYPTDFASAFSLPGPSEPSLPGVAAPEDFTSPPPASDETSTAEPPESFESSGFSPSPFSPDPTETIDPEDTEGLQRTLDNVLQIRDGAAASSKKAGVPFGDYRLLERVAVGGMAEVWRAQRRGVEGFQKTVAIKKILSHLTGSNDFVTMFIDEAKLAAQLNHANIIQIYDLGKVDEDFFIAMEFVDGKDLRSIQNRLKDLDEKLPLGLCLLCVAALARALDYAHRKRDFDNQDLGLVHRDVSPQNVLISYEGEIKLCDFGIVKAVAKASTTQMGALKGKLQYMSPEQAWGKEVDARSDIFSLGSVLFETLTGERLFTGDSEIGVLDAVRDCRIRSPRSLDPSIPPEVEAIVMKALAKTPETRYQTAGELDRDIAAVLETMRPAVSAGDLAALMERLFGPRMVSGAQAGEPALAEAAPEDPPSAAAAAAAATPVSALAPPDPPANPANAEHDNEPKGAGGVSRTWLIAAIILLVLAAVLGVLWMNLGGANRESTEPAAPPAAAQEQPAPAPAAGAPQEVDEGTEAGEGAVQEEDPAQSPDSSNAPATPEDAATPEDSAAGGEVDSVKQLVEEALESQQQQLAEDFEAQKRRLEAEIARVQSEAAEEESDDESGGGDG
ncbi:MAG: protein kinase [Acidobacteriota bacterium]